VGRAGLLALFVVACGAGGPRRFPDRVPLWREPEKSFSPAPPASEPGDREVATGDVIWRLDRALALRAVGPALNVNSLDEVPASSFWRPRRKIRARPGIVLEGLRVISEKQTGVTAGLLVEDQQKDRFLLKLDPPGHAGLLSGSEAVATRLLARAGYNVPDNQVVLLTPEQVGTLRAGRRGERIPALASRIVAGEVLGPMPWRGTRPGDPNDRVPHERRRELRALRVFHVWLLNTDAKGANSLDVYVRGRVRHVLLDFGSSLLAGGSGPAESGWWLPLGPPTAVRDETRRVRRLRAREPLSVFAAEADPFRFRFSWSNPAVDAMDDGDAAWAARILVGIRDEEISQAVALGGWSPAQTVRLAALLTARRDRVLRAIWARASSLARPRLDGEDVCAEDLGRKVGLSPVYAAPARIEGDAVCARVPPADGYHIVRLRVDGPGPRRELAVHVLRGGRALRIVGAERD
jgi:hypothetical protein